MLTAPGARCIGTLLLLQTCAPALDLASLQPQGYLSDFARVVDPQSRVRIESYCRNLERATGVQLALVTLPALSGEPVEDVANTLFRQWGVGQKGKDEGALLLLVVNERRSRLEVGRGLEPIITDGDSGEVLRAMRPALRERHFGDALLTAAHELGTMAAKAKNVAVTDGEAQARRRQRPPEGRIPFPVIAGGLLLLFWIMSMNRRGGGIGGFLPSLILGNVMGRSWGGASGHGGFGGYDSGDTFGGFGGGDSGGGGASSDW